MTLGQPARTEAEHQTRPEAGENCGQPHPYHLHPCQIVDSKVTKFQCQLPHQCHQVPTDLEVPSVHTTADGTTGNPEAIQKSTCQSSRMRT